MRAFVENGKRQPHRFDALLPGVEEILNLYGQPLLCDRIPVQGCNLLCGELVR
jgi:hypothetical protein